MDGLTLTSVAPMGFNRLLENKEEEGMQLRPVLAVVLRGEEERVRGEYDQSYIVYMYGIVNGSKILNEETSCLK